MNSARKDGLVLRHWKREGDAAPNVAGLPVTPADSNAASEMDTDDRPAANIEDSRAAKWNVKIDRPRYSAEEYDTHLKNGDWSKEETDYLVDLAIDYDLRWVVIIDRYDFRPQPKPSESSGDAMAIDAPTLQPKPRTMEDLKSRYYAVAAKCMALRTPLSSMNPTEFEEHEKMTKFDPKKETLRKQYVEKLFLRTPEEAHEEELLLKELSRIVLNQEKLFEDRKALYDRLEAPRAINPAAAHASTTVYQSSQGLQQLMQTMMQSQRLRDAEKREKRRSALGVDTETANSHTAADLRTGGGGGGGGGRSSIGSASAGGGHEKRQPHPTPQHRHFSQAERVRFGIAYPQERLTSGVQFRHERVVKASQAKSAVQTTRINDALAELGIPARLMMPTNRVVTEYERLVEGVKQLVEIRKMREKVDGEIKIWEAQRRLANGDGADECDAQTAGENAAANAQSEPSKDEGADKEAEMKEGDDGGDASKVESKADDAEEEADEAPRKDAKEKVEDEDETAHLENSRAEVEEDVKDEDEDEDGEGSNASQVVEEEEDDDDDDDEEEDAEAEAEVEGEDEDQSDDDDDDEEGENEDERAEVEKDGNAVNSSENQVDDSNEDGENEDPEAGATEANEPDDGSSSTRARSMRKRSASVISAVSNKSSKRQKK